MKFTFPLVVLAVAYIVWPLSVSALSLEQVLQQTMSNHPTLMGQVEQVRSREFQLESAKANRLPTISATANNLNEDRDQGVISLDQPLYSFGKIQSEIDLQLALLEVQRADLLVQQRQLLEEAASSYANILGLYKRRDVADLNLVEHQELHQSIDRRMRGQLASEADVTLANSRLLQSRAALTSVTGEIRQAEIGLSALTQQSVDNLEALQNFGNGLRPDAELELLALDQNANIVIANMRLEAAERQLTSTERESRPDLILRVERDFLDDNLINPDQTRVGLVFESSFQGFGAVRRNIVRSSMAEVAAAEADLAMARVDAQRRIRSLIQDRNLQEDLFQAQQQVVQAMEETLDSFQRQYESGLKSWLDVLNTQRELTEQRYQLVGYQVSWQIVNLRLSAVLGELDQQAGISQ